MKYRKLLSAGAAAVIAASLSVNAYAETNEIHGYDFNFSPHNYYVNNIWVNGADIKDDKSTPNYDESRYYKTCQFEVSGMFTGGTWKVALTPDDILYYDDFLKCLDDKGNIHKDVVAKTKDKATAKINNGVVTVTAGKEAGYLRVWVYEVKKNPVTNKTEVIIDREKGIEPTECGIDVYIASKDPVIAYPDDFDAWEVLKAGKKPLTKLTMLYKVGAEEQESIFVATGDKNQESYNHVYLDGYESVDVRRCPLLNGTDEPVKDPTGKTIYTNKYEITPNGIEKCTLIARSTPAGKTAKLDITIIDAYKVTKPGDVVVRYKDKNGYIYVEDGEYIPDKTKLEIYTPIKVNGKEIPECIYTHTINKEHVAVTHTLDANGNEITVTTTP